MSKHSSKGAAWERLKVQVWTRDGWVCSSCGNDITRGNADAAHDATVDHIVAKAAGGADVMSNLVSMCRRCNGTKQDRSYVRVDWWSTEWLPEGLPW